MENYLGDETNNNNNMKNNSSSCNSKKGKSSEKTKQPQRGLGVAQLEKIRLHTQLASMGIYPNPQLSYPDTFFSSSFQVPEELRIQAEYQAALQQSSTGGVPPSFCYPSVPPSYAYLYHPNNYMIGMENRIERGSDIRYAESQPCNTTRLNPNDNFYMVRETEQLPPQPAGIITRHLLSNVEKNPSSKSFNEAMNFSNPNSEASGSGLDVDLELKL
ncbi:protein SPEAR3-like [Amaranthus tricolor]|uniref:protein SPEAR3-like n=1 Tax=Amaranthus tricolor TaxID=29722 RepID=UPI00258D6E29|nr:protein SPEAR3-like [Amaranthus tricolor]